ncbi:MAG: alpha/beta hydrolase [Erysipelotrichaceae bacterium]|nr:alpha/beta hydrolase [Erysipelotrichaceae bacterium]
MTFIKINKNKINYKLEGEGKPVILLHGWGQNLTMMDYIFNHLKDNFKVLSYDFLGHGESDDPKEPWGVQEYTDNLSDIINEFHLENPIIIGHSFGCRVAIRYASNHKVNKMILTGAAGIKPKRGINYKVKVNTFKILKKIVNITGSLKLKESLSNKFGSSDYKNTSGVMRESFVKIVNDDVSDILETIKCPTLLVWGEFDEAVPLSMGEIMEKKMKDAALVVFEGDDHYAYFHQWQRFNLVIDAMLEKDKR